MKTILTNRFTETQKAGFEFAKKIKQGGVIALHGNLGAGKTTFVQGLAKGLGIEKKIISPTFIIVRKYEIKPKSDILYPTSFYHIDLYRVESGRDVAGLGLEEILNEKTNIVAIEWPEKIKELLPENVIDIYFEYQSADQQGQKDDQRKIKII